MATGIDVLNKAKSHLGETGTNTWKAYNEGSGWDWCVAFVWRCFKECGASKLFYGGSKTAYVPTEDNWFYKNCKWVAYDDMKAGDIVIYTWSPKGSGNTRSGSRDHTGIIEKKISSTQFSAIEGNTGTSNPKTSKVMRKTRSRSNIFAIYRPNYVGGQWKKDQTGWWWARNDGTYPINQWEEINGQWYHFNEKGYMQTGWFTDTDGKIYYLNPSGAMATGWKSFEQKPNWYYFDKSGALQTGWINDGKGDCYLYNNKEDYNVDVHGIMARSTVIDGREIKSDGYAVKE